MPEKAVLESRHGEDGFCAGWEPAAGFQNARSVGSIHEGQPSVGFQSTSGVRKASTQRVVRCGVSEHQQEEKGFCAGGST